ncbi:MAG: YeeE/YedE thiosulfate transporter family protein [Rhizobiaceae bacterium]
MARGRWSARVSRSPGSSIATLLTAGHPWSVTYGFGLYRAPRPRRRWAFGRDSGSSGPGRRRPGALAGERAGKHHLHHGFRHHPRRRARRRPRRQFAPKAALPFASLLAAALGGIDGLWRASSFGCNISALFSGIASGSVHRWLGFACAFAGSLLGVWLRPSSVWTGSGSHEFTQYVPLRDGPAGHTAAVAADHIASAGRAAPPARAAAPVPTTSPAEEANPAAGNPCAVSIPVPQESVCGLRSLRGGAGQRQALRRRQSLRTFQPQRCSQSLLRRALCGGRASRRRRRIATGAEQEARYCEHPRQGREQRVARNAGGCEIVEAWSHYPDVFDRDRRAMVLSRACPGLRRDEHGHFHCFVQSPTEAGAGASSDPLASMRMGACTGSSP